VPLGHVLFGLVEHELRTVLVDGVVGEVHADLVHVLAGGHLVLLSREPAQPLLVHIEGQGVNAGHQHIDPEVEFEALDEVGLVDVPLHHAVCSGVDVF